jgi:hypothetical protein
MITEEDLGQNSGTDKEAHDLKKRLFEFLVHGTFIPYKLYFV